MTRNRLAARVQGSLASLAPAALLIGLIIYLGAEEGGFFPEATAAATVALAAALILRTAGQGAFRRLRAGTRIGSLAGDDDAG